MRTRIWPLVAALALLLLCPALGVLLFSARPEIYFQFPPRLLYVAQAPFAPAVFLLYLIFILAFVGPFLVRAISCWSRGDYGSWRFKHFPRWGFLGPLLIALFWAAAWQAPPFLKSWQVYLFFPLWLGYLLAISAATSAATGTCLLTRQSRRFLLLFPVSAVFWWSFEYLNRFVQNWSYLHTEDLTAWNYFISATLAFSTVLPAVAATRESLALWRGWEAAFGEFLPWPFRRHRAWCWAALVLTCAALILLPGFPDLLFPILWLAPLALFCALQKLCGEKTVLDGLGRGDWREPCQWAAAALLCGFFWELWNSGSYLKWVYHLPYVDTLHVFEMPVLGYAGYLPFGVVCAVVVNWVLDHRRS